MTFIFISFIAGALTVLAPCILPLLPVIVGGSLVPGESKRRPYVIIGSLITSIVLFTLLLKWSSTFIGVPQEVWSSISGGILILFALTMLFPTLWEKLPFTARFSASSNKLLGAGYQKKSLWGDVVMGAALGPVFSSCSPTYFVILATVLPASFGHGLVALFFYALGLGLVLLMISLLGEKLVRRLGGVANPHGWFKRTIGAIFLVVGIFVLTGIDKQVESALLEKGAYGSLGNFEQTLLEKIEMNDTEEKKTDEEVISLLGVGLVGEACAEGFCEKDGENNPLPLSGLTTENPSGTTTTRLAGSFVPDTASCKTPYVEIANPSGYVNTGGAPVSVGQYIGKKVVLVDFMTYSCINCIRTFPYLNDWYSAYADDGLEIIGIHTPEFAFEKLQSNVEEAMQKYGIEFPIVLDNDYGTWGAWKNNFWPRKYLIDINGCVIYDHIGEGAYEETEEKILDALNERARVLGVPTVGEQAGSVTTNPFIAGQSNEVYFGTKRNSNFVDSNLGSCNFLLCSFDYIGSLVQKDHFALDGEWKGQGEYVVLEEDAGTMGFRFYSKKVFVVAESTNPAYVGVYIDGALVDSSNKGADVGADGSLLISASRLYEIVDLDAGAGEHLLELKTSDGEGLRLFTLTFGG